MQLCKCLFWSSGASHAGRCDFGRAWKLSDLGFTRHVPCVWRARPKVGIARQTADNAYILAEAGEGPIFVLSLRSETARRQ